MPMTRSGNAQKRTLDDVEHSVKARQKQEAPAAAEEHPARCPDPLDHRADAQLAQAPAGRQADAPGRAEPDDLGPARPGAPQDPARQEAQDHRRQRGDEAQGRVAAAVAREGALRGKTDSRTTCRTPRPGCCSCPSAPRTRSGGAASSAALRPRHSQTPGREGG